MRVCQAVRVDPITIPDRCNGPADSGNGGYTAGLVAVRLSVPAGRVAQVTLRVPPPLAVPLPVVTTGAGIEVYAGTRLVAEAAPVEPPEHPPVPPVSLADAVRAAAAYPGFVDHPFPTCYVCGPRRAPGDGLRIFPGPLPDGRTAAPWRVPDGCSVATVWAALDCPGGWAIIGPGRPYVLGRMVARVEAVPDGGAECVVTGAVAATEGRKAHVRTALYQPGPGGPRLLAVASSTWIAI